MSCSAVLLAAFLGLRSCQRQFWERTLHGPFTGIAYTGSITGSPVSVLAVPSHGQLEVHELEGFLHVEDVGGAMLDELRAMSKE